MAIPAPSTLLPFVAAPLLDKDTFIANLVAVMSDAEAVKLNYRGSGLFSFYVEGRVSQITGEAIYRDLKEAGYSVHQFAGINGYMPPAHMHDYTNADYDTPDVKGYSQFPWTHVQLSKTKTV